MRAPSRESLPSRIEHVKQRIAHAAQIANRDQSEVTLIAVSKSVDRRAMDDAYALGTREFGENRVQDAAVKLQDPLPAEARLHMIGSLQSNKVKQALHLFDLIHSVDRLSLVVELSRQATKREMEIDVLLQVNVARETQKAGCDPDEALGLARSIMEATGVNLHGLMTIAPLVDNPEQVRSLFASLGTLRSDLESALNGFSLPVLSMGMTNDFQVAIEEGATHVRVGRAIFGG
ncbi:YggS family pyridoxal phosphate-dependent enzyme [soil metagenome]